MTAALLLALLLIAASLALCTVAELHARRAADLDRRIAAMEQAQKRWSA